MRFEEALRDLEGRQPERMTPDLSRITRVAELLGHPERTYSSVHVTGTNGKTTTARIAGSVLCAHGLPAGVYTSPHLHSVTERFALCLDDISEEEFAEEYAHLLPYLQEVDRRGERVTYFETLTALAYLWFADKPVDVGVFEVGMGGTWDATNLVRGEVAVIGPVGLDHPELGSTVEQVATEKAGVIKEGTVAVVREQRPEALAVIEARARDVGADLLLEGRDWGVGVRELAVGGQRLRLRGRHGEYREMFLPLHGAHQAANAAAATVACEALLGRALEEESLRSGLGATRSAGRLEVVGREPTVVVDGAHNADGAEALARALPEAFVWRRLHLVLGILADKDVEGIVERLAPLAHSTFAAASANPRALPAQDLARVCERAGLAATPCGSVAAAVDAAVAASREDDVVLVTGSLYTVAEASFHLAGSGTGAGS